MIEGVLKEGFITTNYDTVMNWAKTGSLWPMSFGLACWVMYAPGWERLATMAFFAIFSYLIINVKERNSDGQAQKVE